jgi:hypothetical protein
MASKKKNPPKNILTKDMEDFYNKNYKMMKKEIKEDTTRWKELLCSWISRFNIVKMVNYQKQSTNSLQFH